MADKKISALPAATTPLAGTEVLPIVQGGTTDQVSVANLTAGRAVSATGYTATNGGFTSSSGGVHRSNSAAESDSISNLFYAQNAAGNKAINLQLSSTNLGSVWAYNGSSWLEGWTVDTSGNLKLPANNLVIGTAGKGIDFSANTHAAGMTSELLDWYEEGAWTPTFYGWTGTYATQIGKYTRIGRQVFLEAVIITNGGTGTFSQTFPNVQGLPFAIQYLGAGAAYGQWFGVSGFSVGATNTSSGTFDYASANEFFCNITGIDTAGVGNLTNTMLSNSSNVAMRIISTYIV